MSTNATAARKSAVTTEAEIDDRTRRALTEYMAVLPEGGDIYTVVGQNGGGEYRVDALEGRCTCPDAEYRLDPDESCKHERRVAFATGEREIPSWADPDAVDDQLGEHVSGQSRQAATDGGQVVEAETETYTYHTEPRKVGGAKYVRCEHCGHECIPADPDRILHAEGCPERGDGR